MFSNLCLTLIIVICQLRGLWDITSMIDELISMEHWWSDTDKREKEVIEEKPLPMTICAPQISHGLAWNWTRASVVTARRPFDFLIFMSMHKHKSHIRFGACPYLACNKFVKCKGASLGWVRGCCFGLYVMTLKYSRLWMSWGDTGTCWIACYEPGCSYVAVEFLFTILGWLNRDSLIRHTTVPYNLFKCGVFLLYFCFLEIIQWIIILLWGQTCVFLLPASLSECLSRVLPTASYFILGVSLWGRWLCSLVVGAFILRNDMPFAKFCGLRVYGCDFYWLFKFSMEVTLSKLPKRMREIQMLNHETANRLSSYLCMTFSQDCQILHVQIWEDFNALSYLCHSDSWQMPSAS